MLKNNLEKKLGDLIANELSDLVNLCEARFKNSYVRALCYQLFENNGVIKREEVNNIIKNIPKESRVVLRKAGIKIGRYHIFLPKMLKPSAVELRVKLWKLYYPDDKENIIPKSGLNFLNNESKKNKKFLLICGFENFENYYVRVDILEKLFLNIIEKTKDGMFKIDSYMMNLLGCKKDSFYKLLELMQYKRTKAKSEKEEFFVYKPIYKKRKMEKTFKKHDKNNPFDKLSELRFR